MGQNDRTSAIIHLNGVALAATMLAKKRGFDPEVAAMTGVLHDLHAYKTGSYDEHEHKGSELAREILEKLELIRVGGKQQVPCLFIDGKPMYESLDIVEWLRANPQKA